MLDADMLLRLRPLSGDGYGSSWLSSSTHANRDELSTPAVELGETGVERWASDQDRELTFPYKPFPRQEQFHINPAKYKLFGGAAGPGKSHALLMEACLQALEHEDGRGVTTLLLRRTFPELEKNILHKFRLHVPSEFYLSYNEQKKIVTWINGARTVFGSMQHEGSVWDYQGDEYLFVGWDELTQFSLKQWQTLSTWNRGGGRYATMSGASNPIGPGAVWVNSLFRKKKPAPGMTMGEYDPRDYDFIPALFTDNPVYANSEDYRATLRKLPPILRAAMLEGRWDVALGAYFDIFNVETHTALLSEMRIEPWWPKWISIDWGYEHMTSVGWHTVGRSSSDQPNRYKTYRELAINHKSPEQIGRMIADETLNHVKTKPATDSGDPEDIVAIYLSPDAFAQRTDRATIAVQISQELRKRGLPACSRASDDRVGGWQLLYTLIQNNMWQTVSDNCYSDINGEIGTESKLIEVLPLLQRDKDGDPEDVLKMEGDDPGDQLRYGFYSKLKGAQIPVEQQLAERAQTFSPDPTIRHIQTQKALAEIKKGQKQIMLPKSWRNRHLWLKH